MNDDGIEYEPFACPTLQRLGFSSALLPLLERQGFISAEARGNRTVFRLRYRNADGQQRARNIQVADLAAVEQELELLQSTRRLHQQLRHHERDAQQLKRERRRLLTPLVLARGLRFHGSTIRAPRWTIVHRER